MKIQAIKPFIKKHGFDGLISTVAPLALAPIALTGMLSNSPVYPIAMMGLWGNSLFQGVKQASPSRIVAYSLALIGGLRWMMNKLAPLTNEATNNFDKKGGVFVQPLSDIDSKGQEFEQNTQNFLHRNTLRNNEELLFGKLIYPALMMITYLASGSYMAKTAKPIEGTIFLTSGKRYLEHLHHNLKAEFAWLKHPFRSVPLSLNFAQMLLRGASSGLFGLAFAQSGLNFDNNSISRIADKLLWAGDFLGGATDIATGMNRELIQKYGMLAACLESAGGGADIYAGFSRGSNIGITARFSASAFAQMAGGLKGLGK